MKSLLLALIFVLPVALPVTAHRRRAAKKPPVAAAAPVTRLLSDTAVLPANLPDAVIIACVHAGDKPHAPAAETLAAVRRTAASREYNSIPRSVVIGINFAVPGVEQPMLAFLSGLGEANLCLLGRRGGEIVLISAPGETVGAGDPVDSRFASWLPGAGAGERYFLLDTRRTEGEGVGQECLRLYSLAGAGNTLRLNDSACEQAGSWRSGALPGGGTYYKGSDYIPALHEWNSQCIMREGVGVPLPLDERRTEGSLTAEVFCAGTPALGDHYYEIQAGLLHIYRTHNPPEE